MTDRYGNIWFTAANDPVRKLNPKTNEFSEYVVKPGGGTIDDLLFDSHGRLWYCSDDKNMNEVGFIDPLTGKVTHFPMTTPNSGPAHIKIDSNGMVWTNLIYINKLARIDPRSGEVVEWYWPGASDQKPESDPLGIDAKNRIWTQSAVDDNLYMFDPKSEALTTYQMPDKGEGLHNLWLDENGWFWTASFGHSQVIGFKAQESIEYETADR